MYKKLITSTLIFSAILCIFVYLKTPSSHQVRTQKEFDQPLNGLHVGMIMDGNRRWAKRQAQAACFGHRKGAETAQAIIQHANKIGLGQLTLYTLSIENLRRSTSEVQALFDLSAEAVKKWPETLGKENIKIRFFGQRELYPEHLRIQIEDLEHKTRDNSGLGLNILFCYGGEQELMAATKLVAEKVKSGELDPDQINADTIADHSWTGPIGSPDLVIRTGGRQRLSNFMPLSCTYSEIMFLDKLWPEFDVSDFEECIEQLIKRTRSFGL